MRPANPYLDPALSVELTKREREAWMKQLDWRQVIARFFARAETGYQEPTMADVMEAAAQCTIR